MFKLNIDLSIYGSDWLLQPAKNCVFMVLNYIVITTVSVDVLWSAASDFAVVSAAVLVVAASS